jgi:glycosyltransferase involved in cell wall biosynthesis
MPVKVSVIVTTYNSPSYLASVLNGYIRQTRLPDELVIADDGSTQETGDIVERFSKSAPFPVFHVWHEDRGFRAAAIRNKAVYASSGNYIVFTDGDCIPSPTFVADHLRLSRKGFFIQGRRMLLSRDVSCKVSEYRLKELFSLALQGGLSGCHHLVRIPGFAVIKNGLRGIKTCNFSLSREDIFAVNGFNEDFAGWGREDAEFAARLFALGLKRRDPLFSAVVLHLWHQENNRENLELNEQLLRLAAESGSYYCTNGLRKPCHDLSGAEHDETEKQGP